MTSAVPLSILAALAHLAVKSLDSVRAAEVGAPRLSSIFVGARLSRVIRGV